MSLKKSEHPHAPQVLSIGLRNRRSRPDRSLRRARFAGGGILAVGATLIANGPLPLVLLAVAGIGASLERNMDAYNFRIVMLVGFNIILAVSLQLINGFSGQFSLGHAGFMAVGAYLAAYPAHELLAASSPTRRRRSVSTSRSAVVAAVAGGVLYGLFLADAPVAQAASVAAGDAADRAAARLADRGHLARCALAPVDASRRRTSSGRRSFAMIAGLFDWLIDARRADGRRIASAASRWRPPSAHLPRPAHRRRLLRRRRPGSSSACRRSASAATTSPSPRSAWPRSSASSSRTRRRSAARWA